MVTDFQLGELKAAARDMGNRLLLGRDPNRHDILMAVFAYADAVSMKTLDEFGTTVTEDDVPDNADKNDMYRSYYEGVEEWRKRNAD